MDSTKTSIAQHIHINSKERGDIKEEETIVATTVREVATKETEVDMITIREEDMKTTEVAK